MTNNNLTEKDFTSTSRVRWCPGCGDYAILKSLRTALATIGTPTHQVACVSGIGCASRLPYYINSYGFHTIHGRVLPIACGLAMSASDDLDVWCITGDGDSLSIGLHHLVHALRRDINMQILLFNNQIYGLTKGQVSPTTVAGTITPTSLDGKVSNPLEAGSIALAAGARFFARSLDVDQKNLTDLMLAAHNHFGSSLVEILQNCPIYNDAAFGKGSGKVFLHCFDGKPLIFGDHGIKLNKDTLSLQVVDANDKDILIHDSSNHLIASLLVKLKYPIVLGLIYQQKNAETVKNKKPDGKADTKSNSQQKLKQLYLALTENDSW